MTKPQIKIVDCTTGEEIVRDANASEIKEIEAREKSSLLEKELMQEKQTARQALLDKLGITADEAKLLLG